MIGRNKPIIVGKVWKEAALQPVDGMCVGCVQDAIHTGIGSLRARPSVVHTEFAAVNLDRRAQRSGPVAMAVSLQIMHVRAVRKRTNGFPHRRLGPGKD